MKSKKVKENDLQPFEVATVKRSEIKPHPKNPRKMTAAAREKLARGLSKFRLLEPFVVNRSTRHVLGGHQRLLWLDEQHGEEDYDVQVSWVRVAKAQEVNVMVLLNQPNAQGDFDAELLGELYAAGKLDVDLSGFEAPDLRKLIPEAAAELEMVEHDVSAQLAGLEFRVVVECDNERQQTKLLKEMESRGFTCRALMS